MDKEFVPYEIALELKELGMDTPCFSSYDEDGKLSRTYHTRYRMTKLNSNEIEGTIAPLYQQAFRWFKEEKGLWGYIEPRDVGGHEAYIIHGRIGTEEESYWREVSRDLIEEGQGELECIKKMIELTKDKNE